MKALRARVIFTNLLLGFWLAAYFLIARWWILFVIGPLTAIWGLWLTNLAILVAYLIWATVFYLLILRPTAFSWVRARLAKLLPSGPARKENRFLAWIGRLLKRVFGWLDRVFSRSEGEVLVHPILILLYFAASGVLSSVVLVRLAYPKKLFLKGLALIWVGCVVEVVTWPLPLLGGGFAVVESFFRNVLGIAF